LHFKLEAAHVTPRDPFAPPSAAAVDARLEERAANPDYVLEQQALDLLFGSLCAGNTDKKFILLKVTVLNDHYSTNIFDTTRVARHIAALRDVDKRLASGDLTLVEEVSAVSSGQKLRHFYSFATKYCAHHNALAYPIFDSHVERMLKHFRDQEGFASFRASDLRNYASFVRIVEAFRTFYKLGTFSVREVDIYLWLSGRQAAREAAR
jgi:hypothetical protein